MYNFIIVLEKPATNFVLGFKERGTADAAKEKIRAAWKNTLLQRITIKDDYDREIDAFVSNIVSVMIENNEEKMIEMNDKNIDTARANAVFIKEREGNVELTRLFPSNQIMPYGGRA